MSVSKSFHLKIFLLSAQQEQQLTILFDTAADPWFRLSGLSPFLGNNDEETLANVSAADWDFDDSSWDDVSPLAKDFICHLMVKDKA